MSGKFIDGGWDRAQVAPYSDRRREREFAFEDERLPVEYVVAIQKLAARGRTVDEIVAELAHMRIPRDQVLKVLEASETATKRQPFRPTHASVGYAHLKKGRPGYGR
jgi:hypothetical protein